MAGESSDAVGASSRTAPRAATTIPARATAGATAPLAAAASDRATLRAASAIANTEVMNDSAFGVLELTLRPTSYDWQFHPVAGQTFTDSGSQACH